MSPDLKRAQILDKVRKLLAKANDSGVTPEESQTFREKADELMIAYTIESWQITADTPLDRPQPEVRVFDMSWWTSRNPFYQSQWWLMNATAKHCRCICIYWEWTFGSMKIAGLPADLDYFDLLFTQLMLEIVKRVEPKPDPSGEVGHEVFKLRQAGMDWMRITKLIWEADLVELTPGEYLKGSWADEDRPSWNVLMSWRNEAVRTSIKNRLASANRRYVKAHGLEHDRNYVNPKVYQRSFVQGFVAEIEARMRRMRREAEAGDDNSMALALRDIRQVVIQWVDNEFPQPEVEDDGKKSHAISREPAFSDAAYYAGTAAAKDVSINANPQRGVAGTKKEIER